MTLAKVHGLGRHIYVEQMILSMSLTSFMKVIRLMLLSVRGGSLSTQKKRGNCWLTVLPDTMGD